MLNFILGMMAAFTITLLTTTTPQKSAQNLRDWRDAIVRAFR